MFERGVGGGTELSKGLWDKKKKLVLGNSVDRAMLGGIVESGFGFF